RGGADANAGIVTALGDDLGGLALQVDGFARAGDRAGGLDRDRDFQVLPGADSAQHAARVVGPEAVRRGRIPMRGATLRDAGEAGADLDALHRVDAHHRPRDV